MKLGIAALAGVAVGQKYVSLPFSKSGVEELHRRDDWVDVDLVNEKTFYGVEIGIGTPMQNVTVQLDTGSSDFWVMGADNAFCKSNRGKKPKGSATILDPGTRGFPTATNGIPYAEKTIQCQKYGVFNSTNSSTFKDNNTDFLVVYGSEAYASGNWGTDEVTVGGMKVDNVSIGVANFSNNTYGILGIGFPALESTGSLLSNVSAANSSLENESPYMNFPQLLKERGLINKVAYSLFLNSSKAKTGSILFGAVDHSRYEGTLYSLPIVRSDRDYGSKAPFETVITLDSISWGTEGNLTVGTEGKIGALLDSGTATTIIPLDWFQNLTDSLGGEIDENFNGLRLPKCPKKKENPQISFQFSGVNITFDMKNIIVKHKGKCYLDINISPDSTTIIGANVLNNMYAVFDLEDYKIAIAKASTTYNESQIEEISDDIPSAVSAPQYSATYSAVSEVVNVLAPTDDDSSSASASATGKSVKLARRAVETANIGMSTKATSSLALAFAFMVTLFL
ncbi:pepsin-like aspartic protease RNJ42_00192 [Nakaseomyces bracarensis]|uniref:pepsin-like aspartic protease n=1 Tax=Nakaseomyces bracarensis TaxID=273131 RepID=UPI0038725405